MWVFMGFFIPKNPGREHNKYHGYIARGTPNCPLNIGIVGIIYTVYIYRYVPGTLNNQFLMDGFIGETTILQVITSKGLESNWNNH